MVKVYFLLRVVQLGMIKVQNMYQGEVLVMKGMIYKCRLSSVSLLVRCAYCVHNKDDTLLMAFDQLNRMGHPSTAGNVDQLGGGRYHQQECFHVSA